MAAAARELRDRCLERVNGTPHVLPSRGKYEVSRTLPVMSAAESLATSAVESSEVEGSRAPAPARLAAPNPAAARSLPGPGHPVLKLPAAA